MSFALYSLLVVGYKIQVDLLLLLLVAFDVLAPTATKIPLVFTSVVSVSLCYVNSAFCFSYRFSGSHKRLIHVVALPLILFVFSCVLLHFVLASTLKALTA
jgi:hypothetical protein